MNLIFSLEDGFFLLGFGGLHRVFDDTLSLLLRRSDLSLRYLLAVSAADEYADNRADDQSRCDKHDT